MTYHLFLLSFLFREQSLQDQLRQAKESVSNMQKLHELAQSQLFEVHAQSGQLLTLDCGSIPYS